MEVSGSLFFKIKCIDYIHKYIPWNVYLRKNNRRQEINIRTSYSLLAFERDKVGVCVCEREKRKKERTTNQKERNLGLLAEWVDISG